MGTVFACQDADARIVAVKIIRYALPVSEFRDAFERERRILAPLRHRNICHLIDAGIDDGSPFMVMEYVDGTPVDAFCRARKLTIEGRLGLLTQVLEALDYLHGRNVVHRDLKPSNILVTDSAAVKILDFGIAKTVSHAAGTTGLQPTGGRHTAMSLRYASPEQLDRRLSGRSSDLYALGVIGYELLTGKHPFEREVSKGLSSMIRAQIARRPAAASVVDDPDGTSGLPRRLRELPIRFRAGIDQLLFNALERDTARRYRGARQFLDDVRRCLDGAAVRPLKPTENSL